MPYNRDGMPLPLAVSLLCSAIYTAGIFRGGFPGSWAVKAASVAALAVLARKHPLAAAALLLGSLGDALLEASPTFFVAGLVAFLCGHVLYTVCFVRSGKRSTGRVIPLAILVFAGAFTAWLWPGLGDLRVPVLVYITALSAMVISSLRLGGAVFAGAAFFLLSDSLLAANRFIAPFPAAGFAIWLTYYAGQFLIAWDFSDARRTC